MIHVVQDRRNDGSDPDLPSGGDQNASPGCRGGFQPPECTHTEHPPHIHLLHAGSQLEPLLPPARPRQFPNGCTPGIYATLEPPHQNMVSH